MPTENLKPGFVKRCHSTRSQMFAVRLGKVRVLNEIRRAQSARVNEDPQLQTQSCLSALSGGRRNFRWVQAARRS